MSRMLADRIKKSDYKLTQFDDSAVEVIEQNIVEKNGKVYIKCLVRNKDVKLTPEEIVRQLYIRKSMTICLQCLFKLKKETILLTKDGSVGIAYKVEEDKTFITSSALLHLYVLDENKVNPDYLTVVLNSKVVQMQAERAAGGSIIQHWKPSEIADVTIPVLDKDIQNKIADKAKKSFEFRKKSQMILRHTIEIVETAIEQGEEAALRMCEPYGD